MERKKKMVGDRIRLGRMANALSLQELSEILAYSGHKLTRAAISNYEMGRAFPSEQILKAMSKELGLSESFFYKQEREGFGIRRFRAADLVMKHEMELRAYLQVMLEQFLEVDGLLGIRSAGAPPERVTVKIGEEEKVEELVDRLRREWGNAEQPIASVCGMLEDNGWYVFEMPDVFEEDQVSGVEESSGNLFIAYTIEDTVDETRYRILEEVGHAYLEGENPEHQKWLCKAFARAMLIPRAQVFREFGRERTSISFFELSLAKQKYGMSKVNIRKRLNALGLLPQEAVGNYGDRMNKLNYRKKIDSKQDVLYFMEYPTKFRMKVLAARKEGLISPEEAACLLPRQYTQILL